LDLQRFHALALIGLTLMGLVRGSNWLRILHGLEALRPAAPWGGSAWMLAWLLWAVAELRPRTQN
jgi:uncharacterized membrane protein YgdD (TMEM256/DUF423 family)